MCPTQRRSGVTATELFLMQCINLCSFFLKLGIAAGKVICTLGKETLGENHHRNVGLGALGIISLKIFLCGLTL